MVEQLFLPSMHHLLSQLSVLHSILIFHFYISSAILSRLYILLSLYWLPDTAVQPRTRALRQCQELLLLVHQQETGTGGGLGWAEKAMVTVKFRISSVKPLPCQCMTENARYAFCEERWVTSTVFSSYSVDSQVPIQTYASTK